jgi:hypothetical protein
MKTSLILLLLLFISLGIAAQTLDENIDMLYNSGDFYTYKGYTFFAADYIKGDSYPGKAEALQYLAEAGYLFAIIQDDREDYTYTDNIQYLKYVFYIGCPYTDGNSSGIAYISTYDFKEKFRGIYLPSVSMEDRMKISNEIVEKKSGTMTFDYWNEN